MAVMNVTYMSYCLKRNVDFKVILPIEDTKNFDPNPKGKPEKFKTVYLLHGYSGSSWDWLYGSRIAKIARDRNLAIVMPSGENSFYIDHEEAELYFGTYVGKELVEVTRKMFPLSKKREDTMIAGLSMGGFGSMLVGSRFSETFGAITSLSGGFVLYDLKQGSEVLRMPQKALERMLGDLTTIVGSERDPQAMAQKAVKNNTMPPVYMACGTEDFVYANNVQMKKDLEAMGASVTWVEAAGAHEWTFWDQYIEMAIDWFLAMNSTQTEGV